MTLDQIRAREQAATEGPWRLGGSGIIAGVQYVSGASCVRTDADAEFIAHARTDVPALLAAVDAVLALHSASASDELGDNAQCDGCLENDPGGFLTLSNCPTRKAITQALDTK